MNSITKLNSDAVQDSSIFKLNDKCGYTPITVQIPPTIAEMDPYLIMRLYGFYYYKNIQSFFAKCLFL